MSDLKERIQKEMIVDHANALEKNFETAKKLLSITKEGKIHINIDKSKLSNEEKILLYLTGKVYAKLAEVSESDYASNRELMDELGLPEGTVWGSMSQLSKENKVKPVGRGIHRITSNLIEKTLKDISSKIGGEKNDR